MRYHNPTYSDAAAQFVVATFVGIVLTLVAKAGVALFHHSIAWWLAAVIGFGLAYGGWLIIDGDWIN